MDETSTLAKILWNPTSTKTLGVETGDDKGYLSQLKTKCKVENQMREAIREVGHTKTELTMHTMCLGTTRITHMLRARGAESTFQQALHSFTTNRQNALQELLPGIEKEGEEQATLRVKHGGIGWQSAVDTAPAAALASSIAHAPRVGRVAAMLEKAGIMQASTITKHMQARLDEAKQLYSTSLDPQQRERVPTST